MVISIVRDGQEIGDWTEEQVRTLFQDGQLLGTDNYWHEGMVEWKPLRSLMKPSLPNVSDAAAKGFSLPRPLPEAPPPVVDPAIDSHAPDTLHEEEPILCGEEARHVYRLAYYQRRVNQVLGIFMLFGFVVFILNAFHQPDAIIQIISACLSPYCIYGAYCFLRLNAEIYSWWLAPFVCLLCLFPLFLIINVIIFSIMLRRIYKERGIPTSTLGVSAQILREIRNHY